MAQDQPVSDTAVRTAIVLVNLGSPASPDVTDVRAYLDEFLMDPKVVDLPWPLRRLLVSAFILPTRPRASAEAYASIWTEDGSPLKVNTAALASALSESVAPAVYWAMRYGSPSIEEVLVQMSEAGIQHVRFVPLYPQWAMSTTETSLIEAERVIRDHRLDLILEPEPPFYDDAGFIAAQAAIIAPHLKPGSHLLMSYHGLPERHLRRSDRTGTHCLQSEDCCEVASPAHGQCYRHQARVTSRLIAETLNLGDDRWSLSWQSRLGRAKWLEPATETVLAELPGRGVRDLVVACPAFVADNLETLEEIGIRGREIFQAAGGEDFTLVPCPNDDPRWVDALAGRLTRPKPVIDLE